LIRPKTSTEKDCDHTLSQISTHLGQIKNNKTYDFLVSAPSLSPDK
jgi:hypothetical protein